MFLECTGGRRRWNFYDLISPAWSNLNDEHDGLVLENHIYGSRLWSFEQSAFNNRTFCRVCSPVDRRLETRGVKTRNQRRTVLLKSRSSISKHERYLPANEEGLLPPSRMSAVVWIREMNLTVHAQKPVARRVATPGSPPIWILESGASEP